MYVTFQQKAWHDEDVMQQWIHQLWKPHSSAEVVLLPSQGSENGCYCGSFIFKVVYVPSGCTNNPFKNYTDHLATKHMQETLNAYIHGQVNASQRRVQFTIWCVGEKVCHDNRELIKLQSGYK